jgi:anthranilate synthase component I
VSAFLKLAGSARQAFLLESVEPGERVGRFSFIGIKPRRVLRTRVGEGPGPFDLLDEYVRTAKGTKHEGYPPFTGGLVGFIGYDAVKRLEPRVPLANPDELGFPEATFFDVDTVVAFDNVKRELQLLTQLRPEDGGRRTQQLKARARLASLQRALARPLKVPAPRALPRVDFKPRTSRRDFIRAVDRAREYVAAGDVQQVVVAQRFDARTELPGFELYRALRRINPSPFMFFFKDGDRELIGASPERLVEVRGRHVSVRPIAGTRKRGATVELDAQLEAELLADPKEGAEHVMLVDLGRNDVGRVAKLGSVKVDAFRVVERYSHVLHLVSQVHGQLAAGKTSIDAVRAAFPAGTLSGAPKVRAMEIIDELEPAGRGPYGGAVGYVDFSGDVDFAITIRTFMRNKDRLSVQAGAGLVHDSVSALEYEETLNKAGALFQAAVQAARGTP